MNIIATIGRITCQYEIMTNSAANHIKVDRDPPELEDPEVKLLRTSRKLIICSAP